MLSIIMLATWKVGLLAVQISHECVIDSLSPGEAQKGRARVSAGAKILW